MLILLAVCAGLAALFATASSPGSSTRETIRLQAVSFDPHAGPVLKVKVRGGSCSFSLAARDDYLDECSFNGSTDRTAEVVARARPRLRRHGLCVTTVVVWAGVRRSSTGARDISPEQLALTP